MRVGKVTAMLFLCLFFMGCSVSKIEHVPVQDLDFTVVSQEDIPEELAQEIQQKKEEPFQLTFVSHGYLYVAKGYGQQDTGGYSVQVEDAYLGKNSIYVKLNLKGPASPRDELEGNSYPYVVLKMEERQEPVVIQ